MIPQRRERMPTPADIHNAILEIAKTRVLMGGNCAMFAVILNRVLEGDGTYLIADGGHYEFSDHVALIHQDYVYDGDGMSTREAFAAHWGEEPGDDDENGVAIEDFQDQTPYGESVLKLADPGIYQFDGDAIEEILRDKLGLPETPEPTP